MALLHDELVRVVTDLAKSDLVRRVFEKHGISLPEAKLSSIVEAIESGSDAIEVDGLTGSISLRPEDIDRASAEAEDNFDAGIDRAIQRILEEIAPQMLDSLYAALPQQLQELRATQRRFEKRLHLRWHAGLDRLEMLITIAHEAGETFVKNLRRELSGQAPSEESVLMDVLVGLHCRACRTAREVLCLLKAGHADGANARWRSLHELAVTALFLAQHRGDTSQRYLDHVAVECWRGAAKYQEHCPTLGYEPLSESELAELEAASDDAIRKYGQPFREEYGWAANALAIQRPTFAKIEESLDMSHWRPFFRLACQSVHAGSHGQFFSLGIPENARPKALAGASDAGLTGPGHQTAISLMQATVALLTARPNLDGLVACELLRKLCDDIGQAFLEAQATRFVDAGTASEKSSDFPD